MMKDSLLAEAGCDVIIFTLALIEQLSTIGKLLATSIRALSVVKASDVTAAVKIPAALQAARLIYFQNPIKSTAGIHFMSVSKQMDVDSEFASRPHSFPNVASSMNVVAEAEGTFFWATRR